MTFVLQPLVQYRLALAAAARPRAPTLGPAACPVPPTFHAPDVALHQAIKYSPDGKQLLVLGQQGKPGGRPGAFCKPTQVAVGRDGSIYVSGARCPKAHFGACAESLGL